jgi:hypothetical protein
MPSSLPDSSTTGIPLIPAKTIMPAAFRTDMSGLAVMIEVVIMSEALTFISSDKESALFALQSFFRRHECRLITLSSISKVDTGAWNPIGARTIN